MSNVDEAVKHERLHTREKECESMKDGERKERERYLAALTHPSAEERVFQVDVQGATGNANICQTQSGKGVKDWGRLTQVP